MQIWARNFLELEREKNSLNWVKRNVLCLTFSPFPESVAFCSETAQLRYIYVDTRSLSVRERVCVPGIHSHSSYTILRVLLLPFYSAIRVKGGMQKKKKWNAQFRVWSWSVSIFLFSRFSADDLKQDLTKQQPPRPWNCYRRSRSHWANQSGGSEQRSDWEESCSSGWWHQRGNENGREWDQISTVIQVKVIVRVIQQSTIIHTFSKSRTEEDQSRKVHGRASYCIHWLLQTHDDVHDDCSYNHDSYPHEPSGTGWNGHFSKFTPSHHDIRRFPNQRRQGLQDENRQVRLPLISNSANGNSKQKKHEICVCLFCQIPTCLHHITKRDDRWILLQHHLQQ